MRTASLLVHLLGLKGLLRVVGFDVDDHRLAIRVRPPSGRPVCSGCLRRCRKVHDRRERAWRHLDFAGLPVELWYAARRVDCPRCGVVTELLPWADPASRFTRAFEDAVAWMAQRMDQTSVCSLMAIAWRTVGSIAARVVARLGPTDRLDGLTHIGIDELSYRRHHKYLTIVTDHVRGRVVWVGEGRSAATIGSFFDELGPERAARLRVVTLDMCEAYIGVAKKRAPQAQIVFDRFHVQRLAQDALDAVRRAQVRELKGTRDGKEIKKTRFALQKRPWRLTVEEGEKLAAIRRSNQPLYRAYLLKESLALVFDEPDLEVAREKLRQWMSWAGRSRLAPFRKVAKTLRRHQEGVLAYVATGLSNGRSEGLNGKVRTITRRAYGFHEASSLIGFIFLCCAGLTLDAPERRRRLARL